MDAIKSTKIETASPKCASVNPADDNFTFLNLKEVLKGAGVGKTTWYKQVRDGDAPAPVKLTDKRVAWVKSEILEYRARLIAARDLGGEK